MLVVLALGVALAVAGRVWRIRGGRDVPVGANTVIPNPLERGPVLIVALGRCRESFEPIPEDAIGCSDVVPPSRIPVASLASLLTSRMPREHGLVDAQATMRAEVPALVEVMGAAGFATAAFGMANDDLAKLGLARGFKEFEVRTSRQLPGEVSEISAEIQAVFTEARDWLLLHGGAPSLGLVVLEASAREKTWNSAPQLVAEFDRRAVDATRSFIEKLTRDARLRSLTTIVTALQWVPPTYPDRAVLSIHLPHGAPDSHAIAGAVSLLDVAPTLLRLFDLPALPGARGGFLLDPRRPADAPLACTTPLAIVGGDVDDVLLRIGPIACTWPGEWATLDWNRTCRVTGSLHREAFEKGLVTPTTALRPELRDELQRLLRDSFGYEIRADPTPKDMLEWELGFDRLRDDCYSPLPPLPDCSPDANDRIQCPHFVGSQQQ